MICFLSVSVEPIQFSPAEPVAYELSYGAVATMTEKRDNL
jgi:hypothetical protein